MQYTNINDSILSQLNSNLQRTIAIAAHPDGEKGYWIDLILPLAEGEIQRPTLNKLDLSTLRELYYELNFITQKISERNKTQL